MVTAHIKVKYIEVAALLKLLVNTKAVVKHNIRVTIELAIGTVTNINLLIITNFNANSFITHHH